MLSSLKTKKKSFLVAKSIKLKKPKMHLFNNNNMQHIFWHKIRIIYKRTPQQLIAKRNIKLVWDKRQFKLNINLYTKKKTKHIKYIYPLYNAYIKKYFYKYTIKTLRDFQKYTRFYTLTWRQSIKQKLKYVILKKIHNIGIAGKIQTAVKHFIMQRRNNKDTFSFWQNYTVRWLRLSLLKNRTIKFYFTPLRTKKWIITKKLKYLKIYARFYNIHPRIGQWSTVGIVGNYWGRNTLYMKRKVLLHVFSNFYGIHAHKLFNHIGCKFNKIHSRFSDKNTLMLDYFERRTDILTFRANLAINIDLARMLVQRGYINLNGVVITNPHARALTGDLITIPHFTRHMQLFTLFESYESFRYLFLGRLYKNIHLNIMSSYLTTLIKSLAQMSGKISWMRNLASVRHIIEQSINYSPYIAVKDNKELHLNVLFNPINIFDTATTAHKTKPLNWTLFQQENFWFNQRLYKENFSAVKKKTIKQHYQSTLWNILLLRKHKTMHQYTSIKKSQFFNFSIFKLLLKDIVGQTWEHYPNNMIINTAYRYGLLFQKFKIETFHAEKSVSDHGRVNFLHFRWLLANA